MNEATKEKLKSKELEEKDFDKVSGGVGVVASGLVSSDQRIDKINMDRQHAKEDAEEVRKK